MLPVSVMKQKSKTTIRAALLLPMVWMAGLAGAHCQSEFRDFSNPEGKTVKAQILGVTGDKVKLKLEGGREIETATTYFSKADQDFIAEWGAKNASKVKYDFDVEYRRKRTEKEKRSEGAVEVTYEKWVYEVIVENVSDADLKGLELQYKIYKSAKADAYESRFRSEGLTREGQYLVLKGKVSLGDVPRLKASTVQTGSIPLSTSQLEAGFYYTDGDKSKQKDDIDGAWFKIFHDGKEVHEVKSSHAALKEAKW